MSILVTVLLAGFALPPLWRLAQRANREHLERACDRALSKEYQRLSGGAR